MGRIQTGSLKHLELPRRLHARSESNEEYDEKTPLSPRLRMHPTERRGTFLEKHRLHTYMIIGWLCCVIVYVVMVEYCIHAHELPPSVHAEDNAQFGRRGTPRRRAVVQAFAVARTVLTVLHLPILTATLATTLPALTQRNSGKNPLNINAAQLFLLADRTWAGAGGWFEALRVGRPPWIWWKLFFVVLGAFLGFPLITLGYETTAAQFWEPTSYLGTKGLGFPGSATEETELVSESLQKWAATFPQRNLGANDSFPDLNGGVSYFPSARAIPELENFQFVTLAPASDEGLVVASALGYLQGLECSPIRDVEAVRLIDMSRTRWACQTNCTRASPSNCYEQSSFGLPPVSGRMAQVLTCGRPLPGVKADTSSAEGMELEVAMLINPDYEGRGISIPSGVTSKFGSGHLVVAARCTFSLVAGNGIVDSVIKRFMHFLPADKGWTQFDRLPESQIEEYSLALRDFLNVTVSAPMSLLHDAFAASKFTLDAEGNNGKLSEWMGLEKTGDPSKPDTRSSALTRATDSTRKNILQDNTLRINSDSFTLALTNMLNSSTITASPRFLLGTSIPAFTYKTDVKLQRGGVPIVLAPLCLIVPLLYAVYLSLRQWNTPTWTRFLDAFAMFRLGRDWGDETRGAGALDLVEFESERIPGFVGDGERVRRSDGTVGWRAKEVRVGEEYVGHVVLGGGRPMLKDVRYL